MKKFVLIGMIFTLAFALCACGDKKADVEQTQPQDETVHFDEVDTGTDEEKQYESADTRINVVPEKIPETEEEIWEDDWIEFATDEYALQEAGAKSGSVQVGESTCYWVSFPEEDDKYYSITTEVFRGNTVYTVTYGDKTETEDVDEENMGSVETKHSRELKESDYQDFERWLKNADF